LLEISVWALPKAFKPIETYNLNEIPLDFLGKKLPFSDPLCREKVRSVHKKIIPKAFRRLFE